jgi:hypothetical protein
MLRTALISLTLSAALIVPAAATARNRTYTATDHSVRASITNRGTLTHPEAPTLTITSCTTTLFHGPVRNRACGTGCVVSTAPADPPLRFAPLDGAGSADLLTNLYSGGANCCFVLDLLRPSAALGGQYVPSASHNFGFAGYRLEKLGGAYRFVTADNSFAFAFTDFADSGLPLEVLRLSGVRFERVTAQYPALVRRDAKRWMVAFRKAKGKNDVGVIAAWAADEATLGDWRGARTFLVAQAMAGRLNSALNRRAWSGLNFVRHLERMLRRGGYLK